VGFIAASAAEAATRLREPERRRLVLGSLARYLGPRALQPTHYSERDWNRDEWARGAYSPTFGVGGLSRFGAELRRPIGPIAFAGSDIAGAGTMHMDGAVRSGHAAADLVLAGA
jgi:putrescine oxidase